MTKAKEAVTVVETEVPAGTPEVTMETVVQNHGDVTESHSAVSEGELFVMQPLSKLPAAAKGLAKAYPNAKGFTLEGASIALHF